jgi:hypothetical protein
MYAIESQEVGSGRERGRYFNDPAFAKLLPLVGPMMSFAEHCGMKVVLPLLPLVRAMMTARSSAT